MKLIELLVCEAFNGNFKWPDNVSLIFQDYDGELRHDGEFTGVRLKEVADNHRVHGVSFLQLTPEFVVTREQYEAALGCSQNPVPSLGAEKVRSEIIEEIAYYTSLDDARDLYEAIAAGVVKGVKLDV